MRPRMTLLAAALLAPAAAHAELSINHRGTGQALYLPYYTVEDGQATLLSLSNNRDEAKAVRVNIVEALNGQKVLSFNVFLAPRDTWTAAIAAGAGDVGARLLSSEGSCTVPAIPEGGAPFVNFDYATNFDDGGPYGLERTRSGAIELIEMGTPGGELGEAVATFDCTALIAASTPGGTWATDPDTDMGAPAGGLSASVDVVDVVQGLVFNLPATAIDDFSGAPHFQPSGSSEFPRISHPVPAEGEDFSVRLQDGSTIAVAADRAPDAVSALFMSESLLGDFHNAASLGASTEWVVSFPTKHAYVFTGPGSLVGEDGEAVAPFTTAFADGGACENAVGSWYDMDGELGPEPDPVAPVRLCAQVQRVVLGPDAPEGMAHLFTASDDGRARLNFLGLELEQPPLLGMHGLPAVGFRLSRFINAQAQPGVLANYTVSERLASTPPAPSGQ